MDYEAVKLFSKSAVSKAEFLKNHPGKYFIRAIMAGFFIAIAMIYNNVIGAIFKDSDPAWGKVLGGLVFSIAVLLIVFIGSELFTGNNLVMAFGFFDKTVTAGQLGKVWITSYLGNFTGCAIISLIFAASGASGTKDYFSSYIQGKLTLPDGQMFCKAVLCNFFVCLAVACGMKCKDEAAKFLMITICISGFVISGFEHCVANMATFVTAYLLVPGLSIKLILKSMFIVSLGNILGGSILLALPLRMMSADK